MELEEKEKQLIIAYKNVFASEMGIKVYEDLKDRCSFTRVIQPLDGAGRVDPLQMAYNDGVRSVFIHIKSIVEKNLDEPIQTQVANEEQD
jgi:hypothetical protein